MLPDAKARGFRPGRFSFNVKGGRCEACQGDGVIAIEMHFLPDVYVTCEECKARRYNRETLEIKYRGKSIAEVLARAIDHVEDNLALVGHAPALGSDGFSGLSDKLGHVTPLLQLTCNKDTPRGLGRGVTTIPIMGYGCHGKQHVKHKP